MLKGLLVVAGAALVVLGGEGLYHIFSNPQQVTMRCSEYAESRPSALWLRLTDCEADYLGAGYREASGQIAELFFPIRPAGRPRTEPAALVAATKDPGVLAIAQTTLGQGRQPDQEQFIVMMLKIITELRASREVEGWGRAGVFNGFESRRSLASLSSPVAPDALVLDLHARPQATVPAIETMAGAIALLGALVLHLRSRRAARTGTPEAVEHAEGAAHTIDAERSDAAEDTNGAEHASTAPEIEPAETAEVPAPAPSEETAVAERLVTEDRPAPASSETHRAASESADEQLAAALSGFEMELPIDSSFAAEAHAGASEPAAESPPAADAPKLRGLLLLRLPPSADPSDIENAPPLGPRDAVIRRIAEILPEVRFDESGQGRVAGSGYLLVIDLGPEQLVHTAIARAEGTDAIDLLKTLLPAAGWRAYSPRTATFIDPARLHAYATPPADGRA